MGLKNLGCDIPLVVPPKDKFALKAIVVTYEIRVFFEGAQKEVFSSI
jgi:hypothetical protein